MKTDRMQYMRSVFVNRQKFMRVTLVIPHLS
jgi:hypothetical protein